ncbi:5-hydroxytryptamine receptor 1-like [Chrysoperla carnea]|uniref:5-hydroxytryptamine receptor 1-like n=1 Tax=Chrysoperla carnea TaxID=189513 RepID=UPI001D05CFE3|nr:5-hydroxytryptamine receptor 1-like [Chrysoperla carnea]
MASFNQTNFTHSSISLTTTTQYNFNETTIGINQEDFIYDSFPIITFPSVIVALVLTIVIFGTVVGNILVCIAVCLVRKLRRPCNYLLVSLAVSDLCVAILVMPIALLYEILGNWPFGPLVCNLWVSFDVLSCAASILNLCMISVDRYYAITKPLEYGVKRTPKRMIFCVFLVWLGAACISLPPLLILGNEHEQINKDGTIVPSCTVCQNFGYQIYATLGSFYIPLTVMMIVYYKIFRAARRIVLDEKKAQSHLEAHCYLEISVKNGGGPPENKIATSQGSSPANTMTSAIGSRSNMIGSGVVNTGNQQHRSSSASTNTTCSMDKSTTIGRCFTSRRSNESQCPMLSKISTTSSAGGSPHQLLHPDQQRSNKQTHNKSATSTAANLLASFKHTSSSSHNNSPQQTINVTSSTNPSQVNTTQKKLRFQLAKERKASTTLGIIMSAFTFCWLPFFVLALVRPFLSNENAIPHTLSSLFLWLGYANSLLNPIIYATLNRDFRKPFQEILYFRCGSLNHMMREEFYHSQYGDPEQQTYCGNVTQMSTHRYGVGGGVNNDNNHHHSGDYDEGVEYIEADAESHIKTLDEIANEQSAARESFL